MSDKDYIIKNPQWRISQDYARLRKEGLQLIEKLGHKLWTDYNVHDPGITQLELLCYAITDLGYRSNYDIKDILAVEVQGDTTNRNEFHTAENIFSCNPVSFNDLRKFLIDINGVRNAWVEQHKAINFYADSANEVLTDLPGSSTSAAQTLNGLYDVYIDYEDSIATSAEKSDIIRLVKDRLLVHRNLCEDVVNICELDKEEIALCADLEVTAGADVEEVLAEVYYQLDQFISPDVRFYSIEELQDKGRSTDEIFAGPALDHGFIDDEEFRKIERHCALRVSDIIQIIMDIPGVVSIKDISLLSFIKGVKQDQQKWILNLASDEFRSPQFSESFSKVTFYKNGLPYFANPFVVESLLKEKQAAQLQHRLKGHDKDLPVPAGDYKSLEDYFPVQNEMPATYRVGQIRVPESASQERKAQSRQLKAWMLFFEQILANYLSQLANSHKLFSWQDGGGKTYFTQQVTGIADIEALFVDHGNLDASLNTIIESDTSAEQRKNKFLDHLLARFCESFTDYSLLMYNLDGELTQQHLIADKREFLEHYPQLSRQRGQGFDYRIADITGYQKRVYRLLGIDELSSRDFSWQGFSIENIDIEGEQQWQFVLKSDAGKALFVSIPCESRDSIEALLDLALSKGGCSSNYQAAADGKSYELVQHCADKDSRHILGNTVSENTLLETLGHFQEYANAEGFHVIEHILLRRRGQADHFMPAQFNEAGSCNCVTVADPYSFRFSIILPAWPRRFQDLRFRQFVEDTLRIEAPAHTQAKICWLSHTQMQKLEKSYNKWAGQLSDQVENFSTCHDNESQATQAYTNSLNELIETLHSVTTIYPLARLHDCDHIDTDAPPITLNNTILGTF